jgi:lauroyl/myristoyl acyltransferase
MPEADPNVNWIRHKVRGELDADTIEVRQSLDTPLQIRRRLAEGRAVAMLMDRHVERDKVPVTMFGRRAHFMGAPAMLAYLTGAPLVPIFLVREGRGRFRARPQEPILVDRTGRREEQVQRTAQQVATLLEREIEERPDCWYQFYRYWDQSSPQASADLGPGTGFRVPGTAADDLGRSGSPGESPDNPDGLINPMIPSRDSGPDSPNPVVGEAPR